MIKTFPLLIALALGGCAGPADQQSSDDFANRLAGAAVIWQTTHPLPVNTPLPAGAYRTQSFCTWMGPFLTCQ